MLPEKIPVLRGKMAKEFLKYDSRELTKEERDSLKRARDFYLRHCSLTDVEKQAFEKVKSSYRRK